MEKVATVITSTGFVFMAIAVLTFIVDLILLGISMILDAHKLDDLGLRLMGVVIAGLAIGAPLAFGGTIWSTHLEHQHVVTEQNR